MGVTQRSSRQRARITGPEMERALWTEMTEAAKAGEAEAKAYINMAGTQRAWHPSGFPDLKQGGGRRYGSGRGRVNTGAMRDAISYQVRSGKTVQVRVGWIHKYQEYFGIQDKGFSAGGYRGRVQDPTSVVEGMRLMAHMRVYMRDQTDVALDRALRRIADGI